MKKNIANLVFGIALLTGCRADYSSTTEQNQEKFHNKPSPYYRKHNSPESENKPTPEDMEKHPSYWRRKLNVSYG